MDLGSQSQSLISHTVYVDVKRHETIALASRRKGHKFLHPSYPPWMPQTDGPACPQSPMFSQCDAWLTLCRLEAHADPVDPPRHGRLGMQELIAGRLVDLRATHSSAIQSYWRMLSESDEWMKFYLNQSVDLYSDVKGIIYLRTYLPTNLPTYLSTYIPIYLPINLSTDLYTHLPTYLAVCLSVYLSK